MADSRVELVADADSAAATGDLARARMLLTKAVKVGGSPDVPLLLKLASICRAAGEPRAALDVVHQALEQSPLDFTALVFRASLLDALGEREAPEAWSNALAQRTEGDLPPPLAAAVVRGEQLRDAWLDAREQRIARAMQSAADQASDDERQKMQRFRSNVLRRTRPFHSQPTHFHFPGLVEREFHPREQFPWLDELEAATDDIAAELERVMSAERRELVPYIQYAAHEPLDQWRSLNHNSDWSAIHLLQNGERIGANADHCPATMAMLDRIGQPRVPGASPNAMFSLLAPNTAIPPHVGVANTRLVCHLPLIVPPGCWFRVGAETRQWQRGKAFVFDDTIEHEAMNPSNQLRVVFIFDLWHPDLSPVEQAAVVALFGAEDVGATAAL